MSSGIQRLDAATFSNGSSNAFSRCLQPFSAAAMSASPHAPPIPSHTPHDTSLPSRGEMRDLRHFHIDDAAHARDSSVVLYYILNTPMMPVSPPKLAAPAASFTDAFLVAYKHCKCRAPVYSPPLPRSRQTGHGRLHTPRAPAAMRGRRAAVAPRRQRRRNTGGHVGAPVRKLLDGRVSLRAYDIFDCAEIFTGILLK